jgi:hypothetical protein
VSFIAVAGFVNERAVPTDDEDMRCTCTSSPRSAGVWIGRGGEAVSPSTGMPLPAPI